ncbi:MAG: response regulator [Bdellovibrionales bacterium]|nr:response regulator [Bdellovibrionales bacterium]
MPLHLNTQLSREGPIAMVDDSVATLKLVAIYHKKSNLNGSFLTFLSGNTFFEYLENVKKGTAEVTELLLLDINMPGMDGFEVHEKLRSEPLFKNIPVCAMLTSSDHEKDKQKAFSMGVREYLIKPDTGKDYLDMFNNLKNRMLKN